jgi:Cu+-exporting ATPase
MAQVIDPVCSMSVDDADAPARAEHGGTSYYFCSRDCKEEFEVNPGDYAL